MPSAHHLLAFAITSFVIIVVRFARSPRRLELVGGTGGLMIIGLGASIAVTGSKE
jgi:hypothetical protein